MAHKKQVAQFIGSGYDVFGKYASPESLKERIFDINHAEHYTQSISFDETDYYFVRGDNRKQYQDDLTSRVAARAEYPLFPATVEVGFELNGSELDMKENMLTSMNFYRKLGVSMLKDEQKEHISEDVRKDLEDADPSDVIQQYGGYVVCGVVSGGRWSVNVLSNKLHHESAMNIEGHLKAAAGSYVSGEIAAGFKETVEKEEAYLESRMKVVGGDITSPSVDSWKTTVTDETAQVIDFTTDGLVPIWDFVDDNERKQRLKEAFERHAEQQMSQLPSEDKLSSILQTKYVTPPLPCSSSDGLGAKDSLTLYSMPDGDGWKYVGHSGNDTVLALKEMRPGYGILKEPTRWLQVWNNSGSYNSKDYSCWIPEAPPGYVALGMFCRFGVLHTEDHKPPTEEEAKNIVVVHESYVEKCDLEETEVWTSKGSGADHAITLGKLKHHALWPTTGTNQSIGSTKYTLKKLPPTDEVDYPEMNAQPYPGWSRVWPEDVDYTPERNPKKKLGKRKLPFESPSTPKQRKQAQPFSDPKWSKVWI